MGEDLSNSAKHLVYFWLVAAVILFLFTANALIHYPERHATAKSKYETAIADGYKAVYDGNDMSELNYDELANKYSMTYLPSQKKILLEKAERYGSRHSTYVPIIIPMTR